MESSGTWKLVLVFTYLPGTCLISEYGLFKPRSPMGNPTGHAANPLDFPHKTICTRIPRLDFPGYVYPNPGVDVFPTTSTVASPIDFRAPSFPCAIYLVSPILGGGRSEIEIFREIIKWGMGLHDSTSNNTSSAYRQPG